MQSLALQHANSRPRPTTKCTIIWEIDNHHIPLYNGNSTITALPQCNLLLYGWCRQKYIDEYYYYDDIMNLIMNYYSSFTSIHLFKILRNNQQITSDTFKIDSFTFNLSISSNNNQDYQIQLNTLSASNYNKINVLHFSYHLTLEELKKSKNAIKSKGHTLINSKSRSSVILHDPKHENVYMSCSNIFALIGLNKKNKKVDNDSTRQKYENLHKITYKLEICPHLYIGENLHFMIYTKSINYKY